jgi:hypothetical protein
MYDGMQGDLIAHYLARPLDSPAQQQQVVQSCVKAIRIAMLKGKARTDAKASFTIQEIGVESVPHQGVHRLSYKIERVGLQECIQHSSVTVARLF